MNHFDDISRIAWEDGRVVGYHEGVNDTSKIYEVRISALWSEIHSLNARVEVLEKTFGGFK